MSNSNNQISPHCITTFKLPTQKTLKPVIQELKHKQYSIVLMIKVTLIMKMITVSRNGCKECS